MPFAAEDIRIDLMRCREPDGRVSCRSALSVRADALRRLGLHPDQPTSAAADPLPPAWWGPWGC
ncbi:hypothetical protein ACIA8O_15215 [Kitasatospora sp. NPDC051853]|uniref:hypothetical protein n=1 Tax=Kitasatospora sp. NPDC051853 TaxID=3364058 RepID=UPI0037A62335